MSSVGGQSRISQQRGVKHKKNRTLRVRNRGARERALIDASARLFADQGYEHTTTRQIAAKAGCAEGLISRYFQGKAGLLRRLVELQIARAQAPPVPLPSTIQEEIRRLMDEEVQRMWQEREFFKMIVPQMILDPALSKQLQESSGRRATTIIERLRTYKESNALSANDLIAFATAITGIGSVFGFWRPVTLGEELQQARRMTESIAVILSRAF
jgi:AcrR family transcriptional regulator